MHILKDAYLHFLKSVSYSRPICCLFTSIGSFFFTCFLNILCMKQLLDPALAQVCFSSSKLLLADTLLTGQA